MVSRSQRGFALVNLGGSARQTQLLVPKLFRTADWFTVCCDPSVRRRDHADGLSQSRIGPGSARARSNFTCQTEAHAQMDLAAEYTVIEDADADSKLRGATELTREVETIEMWSYLMLAAGMVALTVLGIQRAPYGAFARCDMPDGLQYSKFLCRKRAQLVQHSFTRCGAFVHKTCIGAHILPCSTLRHHLVIDMPWMPCPKRV